MNTPIVLSKITIDQAGALNNAERIKDPTAINPVLISEIPSMKTGS